MPRPSGTSTTPRAATADGAWRGSGTPLGDRAEALAMQHVFGDGAAAIPVTATKGQHGHALGATGAWEAALSLLSIGWMTVEAGVAIAAALAAGSVALLGFGLDSLIELASASTILWLYTGRRDGSAAAERRAQGRERPAQGRPGAGRAVL